MKPIVWFLRTTFTVLFSYFKQFSFNVTSSFGPCNSDYSMPKMFLFASILFSKSTPSIWFLFTSSFDFLKISPLISTREVLLYVHWEATFRVPRYCRPAYKFNSKRRREWYLTSGFVRFSRSRLRLLGWKFKIHSAFGKMARMCPVKYDRNQGSSTDMTSSSIRSEFDG